MSDLKNVPSASDLTAYNVDGLELFFTANRKVRASLSAIARMCNKSQGVIRQFIETLQVKIDVVEAKIDTGAGLRSHLLYDSVVIVKCIANYKPSRLADFQNFGINEGLAQLAGVPLPQPIIVNHIVEMSQEDRLIQMAEASIKLAKLMKAAKSNPGDMRQMEMTLADGSNALDGYGSIFDMANMHGIVMTDVQSQAVGIIMAGAANVRKEQKVMPKTRRRTVSANGNMQSYMVNSYPLSMISTFLSAYKAVSSF